MRLWRGLLLILLLLPIGFNVLVDDLIKSPYLPLFPATVIIVIIFLAITRAAATAFSLPSLEAWVKIELREVVAAVLIFIIVIVVIESSAFIVDAIVVALGGHTTGNYFDEAKLVATGMGSNAITAYDNAIIAMSRLRAASSFGIYASVSSFILYFGFGSTALGGLYPMISALQAGVSGLTNSILLYKAITILLDFFRQVGPYILFPVAFSLRAIPFTRQVGNTLIAFSLGVYLFFPLSIVLIDVFHNTIEPGGIIAPTISAKGIDIISPSTGVVEAVYGPLCKDKFVRIFLQSTEIPFATSSCVVYCGIVCAPVLAAGGAYMACFTGCFWPCFDLMVIVYQYMIMAFTGVISGILAAANSSLREYDVESAYYVIYNFLAAVNNFVVLVYLDALIIAVITVSSARSVSAALGGEMQMTGLERLI